MKRLGLTLLVFVVAGTTSLLLGPSRAADKKQTVKELMAKAHKGDDSPLMRINRQLQAETPAWPEVRKDTEVLVELAKVVGEMYTGGGMYHEGVEALTAAVQKKEKQAAATAFGKVKATCVSCHKEKM